MLKKRLDELTKPVVAQPSAPPTKPPMSQKEKDEAARFDRGMQALIEADDNFWDDKQRCYYYSPQHPSNQNKS